MAKLEITPAQRSALRAAAHSLRPVVLIGERGLSEGVLKEVDQSLNAHELIKVRVAGLDHSARDTLLESLCDAMACAAVHHLGRMLILYRPRPAATPANRKRSQPYTPKKLAAQGLVRTHKGVRKAKPAHSSTKPARPSARKNAATSAAHRIPRRRPGSALTLRAGMRRGTHEK